MSIVISFVTFRNYSNHWGFSLLLKLYRISNTVRKLP